MVNTALHLMSALHTVCVADPLSLKTCPLLRALVSRGATAGYSISCHSTYSRLQRRKVMLTGAVGAHCAITVLSMASIKVALPCISPIMTCTACTPYVTPLYLR